MRHCVVFFLCMLVLSGCAEGRHSSTSTDAGMATWLREVDANHAGRDNLKFSTSTIGHRLTGTDNGRRAEEHAYSLFASYGVQTEYFQFDVNGWQRGSVSLRVNGVNIPAATLAFSPEHVDGAAELIDAGWGYKHEFEALGAAAGGRYALVNLAANKAYAKEHGRNPHRTEKMNFAEAAGAAGVIFVNDVDGNLLLTGTSSMEGTIRTCPSVCVGKEDGEALRARLASGEVLQAALRMENASGPTTARNVIATIPGSDLKEEWIVVCGHLDSWDLATGALDNGVGSYAIIDMARALAANGVRPRRTIKLICFMGEEFGLIGSTALRDAWKASGDLQRIRALINIDMHSNTTGVSCGGFEAMRPVLERIAGDIHAAADEFRPQVDIGTPGLYSDHLPFMLEGVTVIKATGNFSNPEAFKYYHSNGDDFAVVPEGDMLRTAKYVGLILWRLADWPGELPSRIKPESEVRAFFERHELKQPLLNLNAWPWKN